MKPKRPEIHLRSLGRVVGVLFRTFPVQLSLVALCTLISALVGIVPPVFTERISAIILRGLDEGWAAVYPSFVRLLIPVLCLYLLGIAANAAQAQIMARVTQGFLHTLRTRMFDRMQELPLRYFDTHNHGDIMSYYTNDVDTLRQLVSQTLPHLVLSALTVVFLLCAMAYFSIPLMLVVLLGVVAMIHVTRTVGGRSASSFIQQQRSLGAVEGFVEELIQGQKVVKVFCHEQATEADFDRLNDSLQQDVERANRFGNIFGPIIMNIGNILYVLMAFAGGALITSRGKIPNLSVQNLITTGSLAAALTIPVVTSYLNMVKQFTANVNQVSQQINSVAMAMAGAERILDLLDQEPETDEGDVTLVNCHETADGIAECPEHTGQWAWKVPDADGRVSYVPLRGDVRFKDVDFAYVPEKPVLHDITLYAKPGQKLAFVGATGAGKTTITNLINRFYDISDGAITYDGIDVRRIAKASLRHSLGIVLQDVNLFTGTVMDNIRYGRLDATDDDCIRAAKLANAHDFITRLPEGYATVLTGNGASLSQGQRQLISIARAAVADPPVMILDEATSSIDTRTELLVQQGMDALMEGRTVFVIAHRLSTVRNSNAIMVLDHGRIIERGDHDDLLRQKGVYYGLYTGAFEME
ncbi:MAG: ABC transporter ATP-binding protein [Ruminococcaceae bacterium]|jgi:ABC-type multidrug transport system, ATPase and permease components|nr:ABC transporter ATP-binding protein [Oscillospiraceae bacterium]